MTSVPPPSAAAPIPDSMVDMTASTGAEPVTMQRRLWFFLPLSGLSITLIWGAVLQTLLGRQIDLFPGGQGVAAAGLLGIVLTVGAVSSVISQPVLGRISDRISPSFLGRRNLFMLVSPIVALVGLLITATAPNLITLTIVWAITLWPLNAFQVASNAVTPERVPVDRRGRLAGLSTLLGVLGIPGGTALGALVPNIFTAYLILGLQLVVVGALFAFLTRDVDLRPKKAAGAGAQSAKVAPAKFPTFRSNPDFWWTFIGRFLAFSGYTLATGLQLFVLRDYVRVGDGTIDAARAVVPQIAGISALGLIAASVLGGILADKTGRTKLFVIISSALFVPAALLLALSPTLTSAFIGFGIIGFAFGAYAAVDGILITRVLSSARDAGRDLGVLNIANSGPQVIAPVLAGALVAGLGYPWLFVAVILAAALASVAVGFVRGVR